jgi:hypothetical protein
VPAAAEPSVSAAAALCARAVTVLAASRADANPCTALLGVGMTSPSLESFGCVTEFDAQVTEGPEAGQWFAQASGRMAEA